MFGNEGFEFFFGKSSTVRGNDIRECLIGVRELPQNGVGEVSLDRVRGSMGALFGNGVGKFIFIEIGMAGNPVVVESNVVKKSKFVTNPEGEHFVRTG